MTFINPAFAAEAVATAAETATAPSPLMSMLPLLLIVIVFYFMVIRPQSKRIQEHRKMVDTLQKGDKVVTGGGLLASVVRVVPDSNEIVLKLGDGVEVTALRHTIMSVQDTAKKADKKADKKN
jgi:preprotein translocase subunit YajC